MCWRRGKTPPRGATRLPQSLGQGPVSHVIGSCAISSISGRSTSLTFSSRADIVLMAVLRVLTPAVWIREPPEHVFNNNVSDPTSSPTCAGAPRRARSRSGRERWVCRNRRRARIWVCYRDPMRERSAAITNSHRCHSQGQSDYRRLLAKDIALTEDLGRRATVRGSGSPTPNMM